MNEKREIDQQPYISSVEPILAVRDVSKTVAYWHEILGFPGKWTWGQPPNHGGVSWHGAFIQFTGNPQLAAVSEGHCIAVNVKQVDKLYTFHQERKVDIVSPLENKPWGMAEYIVREINGYYLRFGAPVSDRVPDVKKLPDVIRIIAQTPSVQEYRSLISAVGWSASATDAKLESQLASVLFAVAAKNITTEEVIGCAFLLGDNAGFYYIKDVMVRPDWQGKGVGTALMWELTRWLEVNAPEFATVGLFTGDHLAPFYRQFGFMQACGMYRQIVRNPSKQQTYLTDCS